MPEKDIILKAKKKLVVLLLIYLGIAFVFFGAAFFMVYSNKKGEAINLSELVLTNSEKDGQYVVLDSDTLPILMTPTSGKDSQFYFVTNTSNHIYIVSLSSNTFKSIVETLNAKAGKLNSAYQIKGIISAIDEQTKKLALANGFKIFKNKELNSDTFSEYLGEFYIKENAANERMATICTILVFCGLFFLIIVFGYLVPVMVKIKKGDFGIFDEKHMWQALEQYLPDKETLTAGIFGVGIQTEIKQVFGKCICLEDKLIPDENNTALQVTKSKFSKFNVYVGITRDYLILSECETYKHLYEFNDSPDLGETAVKEIDTCIPLKDIGTCFPLAEIQNCIIKNTSKGANCSITMKNGSFIKLMLPKSGGLGMPHHAEYREAIIACLSAGKR